MLFYNAVLSRLHESAIKKLMALAALPGGWIAAGVIVFGGATGRAPAWFLFHAHGVGDAMLSAYLWASAVGGVCVIALIATNPRRKVRLLEERSNHTRSVRVARRGPWPYGPVKRAILALASPVNELHDIEIVTKEIELPNLPDSFDGMRMVQLSDFHIDRALEDDFFRAAVRLANEQSPDLVVMTGDFISRKFHLDRIPELLKGLEARLGVYFIRGNHDFWTRPVEVRRHLESLGYVCLDNRGVELRMRSAEPDAIALVGIEHPYGEKIARWEEVFRRDLPACRIALTHTPDVIGAIARAGCDLAVAGHTHGGQVQFPVVGATLVPSSYGRRYAAGWKRVGRTLLYTNRGLGAFFPIRFMCPPEITVFILRAPR